MKNLIYIFVIAVAFASCNMADKSAEMKATAMKEKVQRFYDEVINAHNPEAVDSFCTAEFIDHNPDRGHSGKGLDDLKATFRDFFAGYPDIHATTNFMFTDGEKVAAHITMAGTNSGPMGGMPATNKPMSIDGIDIIAIKDGKATDRWGFFDAMKMMEQMGMMPPPGTPPAAPAEPTKPEEKKK